VRLFLSRIPQSPERHWRTVGHFVIVALIPDSVMAACSTHAKQNYCCCYLGRCAAIVQDHRRRVIDEEERT
jgi:hypothetical protein